MTTTATATATAPDDPARWEAVLARRDGAFVYAVATTGIYCRPSCPARRPRAANVRFFDRPDDAERAGFRPCKRCRPRDRDARATLIEAVCRRIDAAGSVPTLAELGRHFGVSPAHLQRTFRAALGVSPAGYARHRRIETLKDELKAGRSVTAAAVAAGYGAPSRLAGDADRLGMAPSTYRQGAPGESIRFAVAPCPLGLVLVAETERGVCAIELGDDPDILEAELRGDFPRADFARDEAGLRPRVEAVLAILDGERSTADPGIPLDLRASAFCRRVWDHLRAIPRGQTQSYREVAEALGHPTAARAVARACATNLVSIAIPCHRVVRSDGSLGGYRWGLDRKQALLGREREGAGDP